MSALIHVVLGLGLGRMASARDWVTRTEVVEFELRGNSDEITVRALPAVKPARRRVTVPVEKIEARSEPPATAQDIAQNIEATSSSAAGSDEEGRGDQDAGAILGREGGIEVSAQERYRLELQAMLEKRKDYPLLAKRLRQQGKVLVRFTLQRDGRVVAAEVIENSPFDSLNRAAQKLISEISGLKPFPAEVKKSQWVFVLPVEYRM